MNADATVEPPNVVMSYSWDNEDHISWVVSLARRLRANGVDVQLDRWNVRLGGDLNEYMERLDDPSARVIAVISDAYARKASERAATSTGVGVETQILSASVYNDLGGQRVIPVIYNNDGRPQPTMPTYLKGRFFVDFRDDHEAAYKKLLRDVLEAPLEAAPPLGPNPFIGKTGAIAQVDLHNHPERWTDIRLKGAAEINLGENSGLYTIGSGDAEFRLKLQDLDGRRVRHYNDYVNRIGLVGRAAQRPDDLNNLAAIPMSNRTCTTIPGDVVVLLNNHGYWCLIFVDDVVAKPGFNGPEYALRMRYAIETDRNGRVGLADLPPPAAR